MFKTKSIGFHITKDCIFSANLRFPTTMAFEGMTAEEDTTLQQSIFQDRTTECLQKTALFVKLTLAAEKQISKE